MKKILKIILFAVALFSTAYCAWWVILNVYEWSFHAITAERVLECFKIVLSGIFGFIFSLLYVVFILKNGFAKQLYYYSVVSITHIKESMRARKKARLEKELEKMNTEESDK